MSINSSFILRPKAESAFSAVPSQRRSSSLLDESLNRYEFENNTKIGFQFDENKLADNRRSSRLSIPGMITCDSSNQDAANFSSIKCSPFEPSVLDRKMTKQSLSSVPRIDEEPKKLNDYDTPKILYSKQRTQDAARHRVITEASNTNSSSFYIPLASQATATPLSREGREEEDWKLRWLRAEIARSDANLQHLKVLEENRQLRIQMVHQEAAFLESIHKKPLNFSPCPTMNTRSVQQEASENSESTSISRVEEESKAGDGALVPSHAAKSTGDVDKSRISSSQDASQNRCTEQHQYDLREVANSNASAPNDVEEPQIENGCDILGSPASSFPTERSENAKVQDGANDTSNQKIQRIKVAVPSTVKSTGLCNSSPALDETLETNSRERKCQPDDCSTIVNLTIGGYQSDISFEKPEHTANAENSNDNNSGSLSSRMNESQGDREERDSFINLKQDSSLTLNSPTLEANTDSPKNTLGIRTSKDASSSFDGLHSSLVAEDTAEFACDVLTAQLDSSDLSNLSAQRQRRLAFEDASKPENTARKSDFFGLGTSLLSLNVSAITTSSPTPIKYCGGLSSDKKSEFNTLTEDQRSPNLKPSHDLGVSEVSLETKAAEQDMTVNTAALLDAEQEITLLTFEDTMNLRAAEAGLDQSSDQKPLEEGSREGTRDPSAEVAVDAANGEDFASMGNAPVKESMDLRDSSPVNSQIHKIKNPIQDPSKTKQTAKASGKRIDVLEQKNAAHCALIPHDCKETAIEELRKSVRVTRRRAAGKAKLEKENNIAESGPPSKTEGVRRSSRRKRNTEDNDESDPLIESLSSTTSSQPPERKRGRRRRGALRTSLRAPAMKKTRRRR